MKLFSEWKREYLSEGIEKFLDKIDLTDEQRDEIIDHFNKFPNKIKLVNWHDKNLTYDNIKKVMETTSKRQKRKGKGWKEGRDYIEVKDSRGQYDVIIPLTHEIAQYLGSDKWGNGESKWCTSGNDIEYWNEYKNEGKILFYLKEKDTNDKYLMAVKNNNIVELADVSNNHLKNYYDFQYLIDDAEDKIIDFYEKNNYQKIYVFYDKDLIEESLPLSKYVLIEGKDGSLYGFLADDTEIVLLDNEYRDFSNINDEDYDFFDDLYDEIDFDDKAKKVYKYLTDKYNINSYDEFLQWFEDRNMISYFDDSYFDGDKFNSWGYIIYKPKDNLEIYSIEDVLNG